MGNNKGETAANTILDSVSNDQDVFENVSDTDTVTFDINLTQLRGKARLSVNAPLGVGTDAIDYVKSECEDSVDKRYATKAGRKIGELCIRGDGAIIQADIKDKFER
ncbi:hypothetical protein OB955_03660 [Halobacteria archaeon AArc-m2/3/4]|uniref:Uncharacterized protein n=1 Tax=Natronoglomus mannanivorans TaxID=2979990 RepID=A0ABT2QA87_9EURY|nr:hypothetical protein [Halobacteria archaeon AArc-m2/3/4]